MAFFLVVLPLAMAALALVVPSNRLRPWLLPANGLAHAFCTILLVSGYSVGPFSNLLKPDPVSIIILIMVSTLYLFCSFYAVGYLKYRHERSNRFFAACFSAFLGLISLVALTHHLGFMWVAMEGTTLVTAPLIYFNHTKRSIEATWKYLLVGSVGIALALLGIFFLAYSAAVAGFEATLDFDELLGKAPLLSKPWLRSAFILLLVGFGTKMGLAPMHSWKPDAYGEAPSVTGAILAGGVTGGAFLSLMRMYQICVAAGEGAFVSRLLVFMGLFSMAVAGIFMIGQRDFKRMLAYSSVEHMGILALGLGLGAPALYGTLLHVMTNGMTKGVLFLSAGNIQRSYAGKYTDKVQGALRRLPLSASLFLAGFFAITGSPPFGPFVSEFSILSGAFLSGHFIAGFLFLVFMLVVFIGMGSAVLKIVQGRVPPDTESPPWREGFLTLAPIFCLMILVLVLGLFLPEFIDDLLKEAVLFLGNR